MKWEMQIAMSESRGDSPFVPHASQFFPWHEQFAESPRLEAAIRSNLEGLGYGG